MILRNNLSSIFTYTQQSNSGNNIPRNGGSIAMGKVYGIITTPNTPNKELYEANGGADNIGLIFYKPYTGQEVKDQDDKTNLSECDKALPLFPSTVDYPLINEIVYLISGPSPDSQNNNIRPQMYYVSVINQWNSSQENAPSGERLGATFKESTDIRRLLSFEGDRIHQGRKGNGIRFGTTVKTHSDLNEWSSIGEDGNPIIILTNGYNITESNISPHVEKINEEQSSIYMTSTQLIPLIPDRKDILNPITRPRLPQDYINGSQIILNSDRVTLNSKKDEVMIFAKTNVEISTNNIINLNAKRRIHLNSNLIYLGIKKNGSAPTEPVLLGNKTTELLTDLLKYLGDLGNALTQAVAPPLGGPIATLNTAGPKLVGDLKNLQNKLKDIVSSNTFTA